MARVVRKFIPEAPRTMEGFWSGSFNFDGTIRQILCEPESEKTTYNIGIKDEDGMVVWVRWGVKGKLPYESLGIIIFPGEKRLMIEGANKDEGFSIKIIYQL